MQNSNLDVWAIQNSPEEIKNALENVKDSDDNLLYNNCLCNLRIGSSYIYAFFDTLFSSEKNDILLLLMRDGYLDSSTLKEMLDSKNISYRELTSDDYITNYKREDNVKEIWFARERYVLEDALKESKSKGISTCKYYPNVTSQLELDFYSKAITRPDKIDGRDMQGLIELDDKIILLINQSDPRNITMRDVFQINENLKIATIVNPTTSYEVEKTNNKEYIKR